MTGLETDLQGVYVDVLVKPEDSLYWLYVGSSYGARGLRGRIVDDHQNAAFWSQHPFLHYAVVDTLGVLSRFACLMRFTEEVAGLVFLAEAVRCSLRVLPKLRLHTHKDHRLPHVPQTACWNRTDTVVTAPLPSLRSCGHAWNFITICMTDEVRRRSRRWARVLGRGCVRCYLRVLPKLRLRTHKDHRLPHVPQTACLNRTDPLLTVDNSVWTCTPYRYEMYQATPLCGLRTPYLRHKTCLCRLSVNSKSQEHLGGDNHTPKLRA